eukprot:s4872_g3.t1
MAAAFHVVHWFQTAPPSKAPARKMAARRRDEVGFLCLSVASSPSADNEIARFVRLCPPPCRRWASGKCERISSCRNDCQVVLTCWPVNSRRPHTGHGSCFAVSGGLQGLIFGHEFCSCLLLVLQLRSPALSVTMKLVLTGQSIA